MRLVPIECIPEGSFLGKTIYANDGRVLLRSGVQLTKSLIYKVKALNIFSLYIIDEYSDVEIEDIIKPELRQKSILLLKETFANIQHISNIDNLSSSSQLDLVRKEQNYFDSIYDVAEELLNNILSNRNVLVSLVDIKNMDNYTYQHSVNVAVISLVLGISLKLSKSDLIDLCIGALLHDLGKIFLPNELLNKSESLSLKEYNTIKSHPKRGYDYLSRQYSIKSTSKIISLQHHERIDGLGYPYGLKDNDINKLAKIVSVADVYDALTSDRPYRRALSANDALEYIMANAGTMFDFKLVSIFSRIIVPFPFGTIVRLNNGDLGIVQETLPNYPLRPTIKILRSSNKSKEGLIIKLIEELSLVISSVEYNL